jgi:tetratricopeptide (TPR) repeat protein
MKPIALALVIVLVAGGRAPVAAQSSTATTTLAMEQWAWAVMHHMPGQADDAVVAIQRWTLDDRKNLNAGMAKFLSALAKKVGSSSIATKRIADLGLELSREPGMNAFLERAAVLHADAAMLGFKEPVTLPLPATGKMPDPSAAGRSSPLLFDGYLTVENDGEIMGMRPADWNWVFARSLLDLREPKHADDAFVGAWYHATMSFMFAKRMLGEVAGHLQRAGELLPGDAEIVFDRACYAEMQGLSRSQEVLSNEDLLALRMASVVGQRSRGLVRPGATAQGLDVRPIEVTNAEAEQLFRRALALNPSLFEARVRLARLLIVRAQYAEALGVLHAVPAGAVLTDPVVAFYAHLFFARAERGLGHLDAAALQAQQALMLFPDAQSALLASSQIAMLRSDVTGAEDPIRHLAALSPDTDQRSDPWWVYDLFTGRGANVLLTAMWAQVPIGPA